MFSVIKLLLLFVKDDNKIRNLIVILGAIVGVPSIVIAFLTIANYLNIKLPFCVTCAVTASGRLVSWKGIDKMSLEIIKATMLENSYLLGERKSL